MQEPLEDASISGIEFLSTLIGRLQSAFDARVLEFRDELDGSIVVDVRLDASKAMAAHRRFLRATVDRELATSGSLLDRQLELGTRTGTLLENLQRSSRTTLERLAEARRRLDSVRQLRREVALLRRAEG
jgi:hypothetical protein